MSDGISDVSEALANEESDEFIGYCFYHEQDVGRAINGHGLNLAFGDLADTENGKREIGEPRQSRTRATRLRSGVGWQTKDKARSA